MSSAKSAIHVGGRLIGSPAGTLRAAVLVRPSRTVEKARPLPGEPGAVYDWALEQHAVLCKTLAYFGVETLELEAGGDDSHETAVCDAAVAFDDGAVMMRPTAMSRRAEADRLQVELERLDVPVAGRIEAPGLLDGGDVLLAGNTAFVGAGARGNALGRNGLAEAARKHGFQVVEVALDPSVPSLRSVASAVSADTIVVAGSKIDREAFASFKTVVLELGEELAAGVLVLGERHVIADRRYRTSLAAMRRAGITVEGIDLYDFAKLGITPSMLALALKRD